MLAYLTHVIIIAGFYQGCYGTVFGHRGKSEYYVHLTCQNGQVTVESSDWIAKKDLKKMGKK